MEGPKLLIETGYAWLERNEAVVVQRWKTGITLDAWMVEATLHVREEFLGEEAYVMIEVMPAGTGFAEGLLESAQDHDHSADEPVIAMAHVVVDEDLRSRLSALYAARPPRFMVHVCGTLAEALAWADGHVPDRRRPKASGPNGDLVPDSTSAQH